MKDNGIEESLDDLREDGEFKGRGEFTLASERAQAMMERFLLEEPRAYILNLVAAGVASGAAKVEVTTDADDCIVRYRADGPSEGELSNLMAYALDETAPAHLKELALGVFGARALKPRWVKVTVVKKLQTLVLTLTDKEQVATSEAGGEPEVRVHLKEAFSLNMLWRSLVRPEDGLVGKRFKFSPVPVYLHGYPVSERNRIHRTLAASILGEGGRELSQSWGVRASLPIRLVPNPRTAGLFVWASSADSSPSLRVIVNGVSFHCDDDLGWDGVGAIVVCNELVKDLSQNKLVRDQAYLQMVVDVQKEMAALVDYLLEHWAELPVGVRNMRSDLLESAADRAQGDSDWSRAVSILEKVVAIHENLRGITDSEAQRCRVALIDCLLNARQWSEAFETILGEALICEQMGEMKAQLGLLTRAEELWHQHPQLARTAITEILEGLVVCYARSGANQRSEEVLARLEQELEKQGVDDAEERLRQLRLECQVSGGRTRASDSAHSCLRCGGAQLMRNCRVGGKENAAIDVTIGEKDPTAVLFTQPVMATLKAHVCGECGHVEFLVENPRELWKIFLSLREPKER